MFSVVKRGYYKTVFLLFSILLLFFSLLNIHLIDLPKYGFIKESYDESLAKEIQSIDALLRYVDTEAKSKRIYNKQSLEYGNVLASTISKRFYHGYSHYSLRENLISAILGKIVWFDLSAIVIPDDLMKYPMAACSQQSIVMIECFKRLGVPCRKVGFDGHFAFEAFIKGQWYYFDTNKEPNIIPEKRASFAYYQNHHQLNNLYSNTMDSADIQKIFSRATYSEVKTSFSPKATVFHSITKVVSHILWLFPLAGLLFIETKMKRNSSIG